MNNGIYIMQSRYRPMQYISLKKTLLKQILMQSNYSIEFNVFDSLVERSDTSCGIYLRTAFMTVFALHLRLLSEGGYYKDHSY